MEFFGRAHWLKHTTPFFPENGMNLFSLARRWIGFQEFQIFLKILPQKSLKKATSSTFQVDSMSDNFFRIFLHLFKSFFFFDLWLEGSWTSPKMVGETRMWKLSCWWECLIHQGCTQILHVWYTPRKNNMSPKKGLFQQDISIFKPFTFRVDGFPRSVYLLRLVNVFSVVNNHD